MLKDKLDSKFVAVVFVILLAALLRVATQGQIPNFTPIGALALFGGAYLQDKRLAFILPVSAMLISDLFLGFHSTMIYVYASFVLIVALSRAINFGKVSIGRTVSSTLLGTLLFFIITNFGVWVSAGLYDMSLSGLTSCYIAAIPFVKYSLMGDVFFVTIFFGTFEIVRRYVLTKVEVA